MKDVEAVSKWHGKNITKPSNNTKSKKNILRNDYAHRIESNFFELNGKCAEFKKITSRIILDDQCHYDYSKIKPVKIIFYDFEKNIKSKLQQK